jgi:nucleoside-diphosphate-sugar epimerase
VSRERPEDVPLSARPGDFRHGQADLARAQAELGFCPCTDLEQGLRGYLDYYLEQLGKPNRVGRALCHAN